MWKKKILKVLLNTLMENGVEIDGFDIECGEFLDGIDNNVVKSKEYLTEGDIIELKIIRK